MGVYIPKMEMPKNCGECPCYYFEYKECNAIGGRMVFRNATPPTDCPLVPVPPHRDLIDRDALTHKIYSEIPFKVFKNVGRVSDMVLLVWDAPIILTDKDINVPIKEGEA